MELIFVKVGVVFLIWSIGMMVLTRIFNMILKRSNKIHVKFLRSVSKGIWTITAGIFASGFFTTTKTLSTTLLTSSSLLVAVVGFAAQQVLADVISGVMLSWSKPFDIGEKINISSLGISGFVEDMTVRHTVIRSYHNSRMIIPNSVINKAIVENSNYNNDYIGNYLEISVSYESDLDLALELVRRIVSENPLVIDVRADKSQGDKVTVLVKELGENGIILKTTVWTKDVNDNFAACSQIRRQIKLEFDQAGIQIPYNHIHVVTDKTERNA